jgi:hypothetical protein
LEILETVWGKESPMAIECLKNLAYTTMHQGQTASAKGLFKRVLTSHEIIFGEGHFYTVDVQRTLALLDSQAESEGK